MSPLSLASTTSSAADARWAHDVRNALSVASLHLETLERLAGSAGSKAASAAYALLSRAAGMCTASLDAAARTDTCRRRSVDLMPIVQNIAAMLQPMAPDGFEIRTPPQVKSLVLADPADVYRILFNLMQNSVAVARAGRMSHLAISIVPDGRSVTLCVSDDGPGLPKAVRARLFRRHTVSTAGGSGLGIAIARELAERNGATLRLAPAKTGTRFVLELTAMPALTLASAEHR